MSTLGKKVQRIRSKNAGPFWITIDIFCGSKEVYQEVLKNLHNTKIVELFKIPGQTLKRFEIESLNVIKFKGILKIEICMELSWQFCYQKLNLNLNYHEHLL